MSSSSLPQPLLAYPHSTSTQPLARSKGSFGPVSIVLAVITVVAVIGCLIGRIFARRLSQPRTSPVRRAHTVRDVERGFGFDFPMEKSPMAKPAAANAGPVRDWKLKGGNTNKIHQEIRRAQKLQGADFQVKPSK